MPDAPFACILGATIVVAACALAAAGVASAFGGSANVTAFVVIGVLGVLGFACLRLNGALEARGVLQPTPPASETVRRGMTVFGSIAVAIVVTEIVFVVTGRRDVEIGFGVVLGTAISLATLPGAVAARLGRPDAGPARVSGYIFPIIGIFQAVNGMQRATDPHLYFPVTDNWYIAGTLCSAPLFIIYGVLMIRGGSRAAAS